MKLAAFALVLQNKQLLLTKRLDVPVWVLPGGGIERGETPEEAAIREVKEETGVDIVILRKTHEMVPINRLSSPTFLFLCKPCSSPKSSSNETAENRYFPLDNLPKELFFAHRIWIEEALQNPSLIKRPLSEINYKAFFKYFLKRPLHVLSYLKTRLIRAE